MQLQQDQRDVDDDVSNRCVSSDVQKQQQVENRASTALRLTVEGLCMVGRLLMAVVKAVIRLWTSNCAAPDASAPPTTATQPACSDIATHDHSQCYVEARI